MKSWHHILWATVALGALFVALQAVQAWKASMTSELTQKANNSALRSQLDALKAERAAATTPEQQAQLVGRYLAPIWQKRATITPSQLPAMSAQRQIQGGEVAQPAPPRALPDAPSAVQKFIAPEDKLPKLPIQSFDVPSQPGELFGGDYYVPPPFLGDFTDAMTACQENKIKLATCQKNLATANDAAEGGGFWHRLSENSKWFVIGSLAGAGAILAAKH